MENTGFLERIRSTGITPPFAPCRVAVGPMKTTISTFRPTGFTHPIHQGFPAVGMGVPTVGRIAPLATISTSCAISSVFRAAPSPCRSIPPDLSATVRQIASKPWSSPLLWFQLADSPSTKASMPPMVMTERPRTFWPQGVSKASLSWVEWTLRPVL